MYNNNEVQHSCRLSTLAFVLMISQLFVIHLALCKRFFSITITIIIIIIIIIIGNMKAMNTCSYVFHLFLRIYMPLALDYTHTYN